MTCSITIKKTGWVLKLLGPVVFLTLFNSKTIAQTACDCKTFQEAAEKRISNPAFNLKEAIALVKENNSPGCQPGYYELLAEGFIGNSQFDSAEIYLQQAYSYYIKNNCQPVSMLNYYRQQAALLHKKGDFTASVEVCFKILDLVETPGNKYEKANTLLLISDGFNRIRESAKGIEYARQALPVINELDVPLAKANLLHDVAVKFLWRYQDTKNNSLLDSAELFANQAAVISRSNHFSRLLAKIFNKMNGFAHERKNYRAALGYIDSSLKIFNALGDTALIATSYGDKADVFMEMKDYTQARKLADTCLALHQKVKSPETIANAYALIYEISNRSANYKDAVWAMNSYIEITDSLSNAEKSKQINELEQKYNKAKNEKTIKELAQEKRIYLLLALAGLLAVFAVSFFLRQQKLKHKKDILETEQRLNRARMNPHFFFNALTALQKFALKENNGQMMASNLSKFSNIMRETLESTYKEYVTIEQEMEFLNEYLEVQKIRFPQTFSYEITAAKELEIDELQIPAMIIQPFVENSIEHGFAGVDYPGRVSVQFTPAGNDLLVVIADNGKGLHSAVKENNEHISRASQIIKDRIYLLNIKLKTKAGFSIDNNPSGQGVVVKINLPLLYKNKTGS
ncbi:MAG: histidine kinase [Ferruginibacter sp.]